MHTLLTHVLLALPKCGVQKMFYLCKTIFHELCFFIPGEKVPAINFEDALHHSLREVTLHAERFVVAIQEAWETFQSKKIEESNQCVLLIFQPYWYIMSS